MAAFEIDDARYLIVSNLHGGLNRSGYMTAYRRRIMLIAYYAPYGTIGNH